MSDQLKEQLKKAIDEGNIVTFHPTRRAGEVQICVRHPDHPRKCENHVVDFDEMEISHIILRKLCR